MVVHSNIAFFCDFLPQCVVAASKWSTNHCGKKEELQIVVARKSHNPLWQTTILPNGWFWPLGEILTSVWKGGGTLCYSKGRSGAVAQCTPRVVVRWHSVPLPYYTFEWCNVLLSPSLQKLFRISPNGRNWPLGEIVACHKALWPFIVIFCPNTLWLAQNWPERMVTKSQCHNV